MGLPWSGPGDGPLQEQLVGAVPSSLPVRMGLESAVDPPVMSHDPLPEAMCLGQRIRRMPRARRDQREGRVFDAIRRRRVRQNLSFAIRPSNGPSAGSAAADG